MRRIVWSSVAVSGALAFAPMVSAQQCPPELAQATSQITTLQAVQGNPTAQVEAPRALAGARQEVQAPRGMDSVEAPRGQNVQAPRGLDSVEAPRGQDVQAPRGLDSVEAPRGQNVQAPRGLDSVEAPRTAAGARAEGSTPTKLDRARELVADSERACKAGNMALSSEKAKAALAVLK